MKIRDAELSDFDNIPRLLLELGYQPGPKLKEVFQEILSSKNMGILLAENESKKIVGLLSYSFKPQLRLTGPSLEMDEFIVSDEARGKGVGKSLIEAVKQRAIRFGCSRILVSTNKERESFKRDFYTKNGFTPINSVLFKIQLK